MDISYLPFPGEEAEKLIKDLGVKTLPVYLLDKRVGNDPGFNTFKPNLERKGDFYMIQPKFAGVGYFLEREKIKGKLDLFISLYDKNAVPLLDVVKDSNPSVHFLAINKDKGFEAANGNSEVEEYLRGVCVQKYYPQAFFDYISCRAKNINSSWWEDCLPPARLDAAGVDAVKMDVNKIKVCARGAEGAGLLSENVRLNKEIQIMVGPVYFMDNHQIFGIQGVPKKEELKKILSK